ncbi:2-octaprenyl-6-methoxyphenol hydroxylase [Aureimonas endophytica]|uniref:2-octaprenyl-6-methoxyphenol hydroxylase n=1 Tax=Aureimonas endophytica TaxID=2027858 RepID=A0A916ZD04_9HYPH|nr:2-octaprenyl-6-methoxyphenol hydroxylase [Aureimonas endophytica]
MVGGGLAGFSAAIAFAAEGFATALLAPPPGKDHRSTALLGASVGFLDRLGVVGRLGASAQPLATMRIVDDTGRLLRAPTVEFKAGEIGLAAFGYNVLNSELNAALRARAAELAERLTIVESAARSFAVSEDEVRIDFEGGRVVAALAVAADGRNSLLRREAGIRLRDWHYPQAALVLNFEHDIAHNGVSTEFHTRTGPFTQVPLPGRRSSLVWVERPETAALLVDLKPERLAMTVEEKLHSILGTVRIDGPVQSFPLKGAVAETMTGRRVALIGETAHVFPPIGAQGLNLGLRDAADLARIAATARDDPGRRAVTLRYEAERRQDVLSRTLGVDLLNRSLLAGYLPIQAARSVGLAAMAAFGPLRRFAMREGTVPGAGLFGLPASMREDRGETEPARVR